MSALLPLTLQARPGAWNLYHQRRLHPKFAGVQQKIWERDAYTCRYCGFRSERYQDVVNQDGNYAHNALSNLVTACLFCTQCQFLDGLAFDARFGGRLILLPELSQINLNHMARILFCALEKDSPYRAKLQSLYLSLKDRSKPIENSLGPDTSLPGVFGKALLDAYLTPEQLAHPLLQEIRLLPSRTPFQEAIVYWKDAVFSSIPL